MTNKSYKFMIVISIIIISLLFSFASAQQEQVEAYFNQGIAYVMEGEYDQAISDFGKAIELNPFFDEAYNNRGYTYMRKGQYDQAICDFETALMLNPGYVLANNNLAWVFATAKEPCFHNGKEAVEMALKACRLSDWQNPSMLDTLAAAYARVGDFNNAVKWQEKALESFGGDKKKEALKRLNLYQGHKPWQSD